MTVHEAELVLDAGAELGEGPVWDLREQRLIWLDIMRGRVHLFDPATATSRTLEVDQPVGSVAPRASGGLVAALRDGFGVLDLESGRLQMIAEVDADRPDHRMNDGKCDAAGRFWAGTMALDMRRGAGSLYRLDPDGSVSVMLREVSVSNGLDWNLDGRTMFYVDSSTRRIDAFDYDETSGTIANRRPFVRVPREIGFPDGLTLDAEGFVWVAVWGGGVVHRYAPDGALDAVVSLPTKHPTSCAFGGPDFADLYITTATMEIPPAELARQPHAGAVFRCRPGVSGRAPHAFGG